MAALPVLGLLMAAGVPYPLARRVVNWAPHPVAALVHSDAFVTAKLRHWRRVQIGRPGPPLRLGGPILPRHTRRDVAGPQRLQHYLLFKRWVSLQARQFWELQRLHAVVEV